MKEKNWLLNIIETGILAGIAISVGGTVFLKVGGIIGAVLFAFGLTTVVYYKLKLYTGTAGFIQKGSLDDWTGLVFILLSNIVGCAIWASLMNGANPEFADAAYKIIESRMNTGWLGCGILAVGCGFIMTTAVQFARKDKYIALLLGVPCFIMCGFAHSIADAFYFSVGYDMIDMTLVYIYLSEVVGNFIGCNLWRIVAPCLVDKL
jgi:formate/nitrite transporter FocA (FNT family)